MTDPPIKQRLRAILAADAAGFSRLMSQDEHATVVALDAARQVFKAQIEAQQGRVIDMAGDSVLAVFETATGAVAAALAIQHELAANTTDAAPQRRMHFRIGVHLGDVIEKADGTVYGDGVNVAARLQVLAQAGGITVSDSVYGVVGGRVIAKFIDQGEQTLKNIARPIRAYAIDLGLPPAPAPATAAEDPAQAARPSRLRRAGDAPAAQSPAAAADPTPTAVAATRTAPRPSNLFVGRQQELTQLTKALDSARQGRGRVVLLAGSGGIGKTRLAQQLAALAEPQGVPVLWGRCLEEPGAPPYWPWRQLIRSYLRGGSDDDPARTLGADLADIAGIVPEVAEQFGVPPRQAEAGDSAQSRFRLFDAVTGFWRRAAQRVPLLLIFEDLHFADATSLRLFGFLANEIDDSRLLLLGTYRDTELSRQHPLFETLAELARASAFQRLELAGLSSRETEEFLAAASGATASARWVSALHARTEGHPLFLEETLRLMLEGRGALDIDPVDGDPRLLTTIPSGVREVIGKRLNRLSPTASRLLSIAACIGRTFELQLLARLEVDKSEDEILDGLEEALAVHLIEAVPQSHQFRFSHALIRETLYDEMLGLRRSRLHLRIAEILEQRHDADDAMALAQLAYHFSEAGPGAAAKALDYARRSAEHAAQLLAFEEAARLYRLALQLQQQHFARDAALRCGLLLGLGRAEMSLGAGEPARAAYWEAAELARNHGLPEPFAQAAVGFERSNRYTASSGEPSVALLLEAVALHQADDPMRVELLANLCRAYVYSDRADEAKQAHRRAVALAREIGDPRALAIALSSIATAIYWPELLQQRLSAAKEAWALAEDVDVPLIHEDLLPFHLLDLMRVGDVPALRRLSEHGLQLTTRSLSLYDQAICQHLEAVVALGEGRFDDAEAWANKALATGRRVAQAQAVTAYGTQMFCLRREQGRLREALPMLQHFVRTTPKSQTWQPGLALLYAELDMRAECQAEFDNLPWKRVTTAPSAAGTMTVLMFAAEMCVYLGDAARAALLYPSLKGHAGANLVADTPGPCLGSADRLLGSLCRVMGQWQEAERHFEAALALDRQSGWRVWLTHSRYDFALMLQRRAQPGDAERARALLAEALAESTALGMEALAPRIQALAETLAKPPPAYPCGLSEREVEVLRLLAMGRNNREIGQVLAISPNTVANHVRSILEKTYTANRTEAAAFANREGLLEP
jgi:class 3 adenylate cyclase/DNA-binding CsgD family transcriptional regulator/tetratricopeptide (TPR) repeat protein